MAPDTRSRADARLQDAARAAGFADPRPPLRERMRLLKESHPDAFERARTHYEQVVQPALADDDDPLTAWVQYAAFLGGLLAGGKLVAIDESGASRPFQAPSPGLLVLHIPDDTAAGVLPALSPESPSPAQLATVDLLVNRKLSL